MRSRIQWLAGLAVVATAASSASALDLHQLWDQRCQECHGHAGDFARRHLAVESGRLVGRHHRDDLKRFMAQHEMGAEHVERIYAMLLAQATTAPVYQQKCAGCHGTAAELARTSIARQDGDVVALPSRRPLVELLQRHGKLTAAEIPVVVESLTRVLSEVAPQR